VDQLPRCPGLAEGLHNLRVSTRSSRPRADGQAVTVGLLGVRRVVAMSGLPAVHDGGRYPSWVVNPWDSRYLDVLDYQWQEISVPFWTDIQARARDADVKVCIEMHPHNVVFNPAAMERLATDINAIHVGAEMDQRYPWAYAAELESVARVRRGRPAAEGYCLRRPGRVRPGRRRRPVLAVRRPIQAGPQRTGAGVSYRTRRHGS
jgi:hypothetical protein